MLQAAKMEVEDIANILDNMSKEEMETLLLLIEKKDKELLKRKQEIEAGKVETLSRDEVFGV
jgi:Mg/Co/Ni transporter MgtE